LKFGDRGEGVAAGLAATVVPLSKGLIPGLGDDRSSSVEGVDTFRGGDEDGAAPVLITDASDGIRFLEIELLLACES